MSQLQDSFVDVPFSQNKQVDRAIKESMAEDRRSIQNILNQRSSDEFY
jgi:hypothetical protein